MIEIGMIIKWILGVLVLGIVSKPLLSFKSMKLIDGGFTFSALFGSLLCFFISWFISSCGLCSFSTGCCIFGVLIVAAASAFTHFFMSKGAKDKNILFEVLSEIKASGIRYIIGFLVFGSIVVFYILLKINNPTITSGTEQYMDYGYINAIYLQSNVPVEDIWNCGNKFNYYYLGFAYAAYLCKVFFVPAEYGYNLMLATVFSFLVMGTFVLVEGYINCIKERYFDSVKSKIASIFAGIVAVGAVVFSGNGHWLFFGIIAPVINKIFHTNISYGSEYGYWYPDATTYIGNFPTNSDQGKTEFPAYTLILGDLHPHLINTIFVILLLGIVLDYSLLKASNRKNNVLFSVYIGFLLGIFQGINYWDFAIYFVVTAGVVLFSDIKQSGLKVNSIFSFLKKIFLIALISQLTMLPFNLQFTKMASHICVAKNHTPLLKFLIIWSPYIVLAVIAIAVIIRKQLKEGSLTDEFPLVAFILCGLGLLFVPEVIYLQDIYETNAARFNTMFKLTYEGFIILGLSIGILAGFLWLKKRFAFNALLGVFVCLASSYFFGWASTWILNSTASEGLSCESGLHNVNNLEERVVWEAAQYLKEVAASEENSGKALHVLEMSGDDYTPSNLLSTLSGCPTVMGWPVHEWLWTTSSEYAFDRQAKVAGYYESHDYDFCQEFLEKYDIDYVFIGPNERSTYAIDMELQAKLGELVWLDSSHMYCLYRRP